MSEKDDERGKRLYELRTDVYRILGRCDGAMRALKDAAEGAGMRAFDLGLSELRVVSTALGEIRDEVIKGAGR